ncbi:hypothetical protein GBA52_028700 [Prunus armeniaca]|nr:hypothetical protein GBA52_028700 [Prunus armeniaca]
MTAVSGLTGSPSRCCFQIPVRSSGSLCGRVSNFPHSWKPAGKNELLRGERSYWTGFTQRLNARKTHLLKFAMDASYGDIPKEPTGKASYGDIPNEPTAIFPRINVRDPYKRLGISREASEDEIQGARNFLIRQYAGHKPSVDAIESAHDKIIMQQFYDRKNPKIDFKKGQEVNQSQIVQTVRNRLKSKLRAVLYSAGAFVFSWLVGTFLMVSVIPPILKGPRSFEVTTSLITYALLWVSSTYLK